MKRLILAFGTLLLLLGACKTSEEPQETPKGVSNFSSGSPVKEQVETSPVQLAEKRLDTTLLFLQIETTPCYGTCPVFTMTVYQNGFAMYEGKHNVKHIGEFTGRLSLQQITEIKQRAKEIGFFELNAEYDAPVADLPTVTTYLNTDGQNHRVLARMDVPEGLRDFNNFLTELAQSIDWVPVEAETQD